MVSPPLSGGGPADDTPGDTAEDTKSSGVRWLRVSADEAGMRLDRWFKRRIPHIPHGRLERWLRTGQVRVDGGRCKAGTRLETGQTIRVPPVAADAPAAPARAAVPVSEADAAELVGRILHIDDDIIALNKPAGLAVQGGTGTKRHLDAMMDALSLGGERPRLVHRLDRDTSGVLILARSAAVAARLGAAFRSRAVAKLYWAIVAGVPTPPSGRIDQGLAKRAGPAGERIIADAEGLRAVTFYRVLARAGRRAAWLAMQPQTGRTHQLRAHCVILGTPILGDGKYGGRQAFIDGLDLSRHPHLHARALTFAHPAGGTRTIVAPPPPHLRDALAFFGFAEEEGDVWPIEAARR